MKREYDDAGSVNEEGTENTLLEGKVDAGYVEDNVEEYVSEYVSEYVEEGCSVEEGAVALGDWSVTESRLANDWSLSGDLGSSIASEHDIVSLPL